MKYESPCQKIYSRIAPWVTSLAAIAIGAERAHVYAETLKVGEERATLPLGEVEAQKNSSIKTKEEACKLFEGKIITYYDQSTYVQNCRHRPIVNVEVLNVLASLPGKTINEVPAKVYRLLPFGPEFTEKDLTALVEKTKAPVDCSEINGKYVTVNSLTFYYIEGCKKHELADRFSLEQHNRKMQPILTIKQDNLDRIPAGPGISISQGEYGILYKMDGDTQWSKLFRNRADHKQEGAPDSPETLQKTRDAGVKINKPELCKRISNKIVSYYSQMYYVDDCAIRAIKDFSNSIVFQARVEETGGVYDLSPEQMKALSPGKDIEASEVLRKLK